MKHFYLKLIAQMPRLAVLSCATLAMGNTAPKAPSDLPTLLVGYNHVPPDSLHMDGKPSGPAHEFLERIGKRMGVKFKYEFLPLSRLIAKVNANQIDLVNRIGANPALSIKPAVPFTETIPGILVAKRLGITTWKELEKKPNMRIGTKGGMPLTETMKRIRDRISYQPGDDALQISLRMTRHDRLDGVYSPTIGELVFMASEMKILQDFVAIRLPDPLWSVFVAFSPAAHKLHYKSYVEALKAEQQKEPYQAVYERYLRKVLPGLPADVMKILLKEDSRP